MTMGRLRVAAVQMSSQDDLAKNLRRVGERIEEAASMGARAVVLPENFAFMGKEAEKHAIAEALSGSDAGGPILSALASAARGAKVWVIGGGMPTRSGDPTRPFNSCVVLGPDGALRAHYHKAHLFDVELADGSVYRESGGTTPGGGEAVVVDIEGWKVGLSICYDLRFPELYRRLSEGGAEVIVIPSAFTVPTGKDHWHVLLRARAIEAQAYVIAPAQWGRHPHGRLTYGKSLIADPWGDVIAQASEGEGVVVAELRRGYLEEVRDRLPSLRHRRL